MGKSFLFQTGKVMGRVPRAMLASLLALTAIVAMPGADARNKIERNVKGPAVFRSANNEFTINLPFESQRIEHGNFDRGALIAVNIDGRNGEGHYSVEWVNAEMIDAGAFGAYWQDFLPTYLARNFGSGGYRLVERRDVTTRDGRAAIEYVASGTNNGGGKGTIIGRATDFGTRFAMVYTIVGGSVDAKGLERLRHEIDALHVLADSLQCLDVCAAGKAEETPALAP